MRRTNSQGGRRKRCVRYNEPGHAHCLTFSCYDGLPLLSEERVCRWMIESLEAARGRHAFDLWGYVLMPEHVHLLLSPRLAEYSISRILHAVKRPVAYRVVAHLGDQSPGKLRRLAIVRSGRHTYRFWQAGGGHDRNLTTPKAMQDALDYLHKNPVRRGLVERPTDWQWSSAGFWAGEADVPIKMDRSLPMVLA